MEGCFMFEWGKGLFLGGLGGFIFKWGVPHGRHRFWRVGGGLK